MDNKFILNDEENGEITFLNVPAEMMELTSVPSTSDGIEAGNIADQVIQAFEPSGNANGGGPIHFELDGKTIGSSISFATTSDWGTWATKTVTGIPLTGGEQILRVAVDDGEVNLGKMTFTRTGDLSFDPPVADAGTNVSTTLSNTSVTLDGSGTYEPTGKTVSYAWSQVYGPTQLNFATSASSSPQVSNLAIGVYKCLLTVSDGTYTSTDEVQIIVSESGNSNPSISINSPSDGASFAEGTTIEELR